MKDGKLNNEVNVIRRLLRNNVKASYAMEHFIAMHKLLKFRRSFAMFRKPASMGALLNNAKRDVHCIQMPVSL